MKMFCFMYPGHPVGSVFEMTREEFIEEFWKKPTSTSDTCLKEFKALLERAMGHPVSIVSLDGQSAEDDPIVCDLCSVTICGEGPILVVRGSLVYCPECFASYVKPYCKPIGEG